MTAETASGPAADQMRQFAERVRDIREQLHETVVGQDETIDLLLTNPMGGVLIDAAAQTAQVTINDYEEGIAEFQSSIFQVDEGGANAQITINRINGSNGVLQVIFETADGSAIPVELRTASEQSAYLAADVPIRAADALVPAADVVPVGIIDTFVSKSLKHSSIFWGIPKGMYAEFMIATSPTRSWPSSSGFFMRPSEIAACRLQMVYELKPMRSACSTSISIAAL